MNKKLAVGAGSAVAVLASVGLAAPSFAAVYDPTADIGTAITGLGTQLGATIGVALPYAVGLVGAFFAWRIVRKLVHA